MANDFDWRCWLWSELETIAYEPLLYDERQPKVMAVRRAFEAVAKLVPREWALEMYDDGSTSWQYKENEDTRHARISEAIEEAVKND